MFYIGVKDGQKPFVSCPVFCVALWNIMSHNCFTLENRRKSRNVAVKCEHIIIDRTCRQRHLRAFFAAGMGRECRKEAKAQGDFCRQFVEPKSGSRSVLLVILIFVRFGRLFFCQIYNVILYVNIKLFVVRQLYFIAKMNRISQIFRISADAAADSVVFYKQ